MKPIQTLHINYFKFFADNASINVDGKHLLIYGENGSGKSSIYWALYTLLEAVYKDDIDLNKYFIKSNDNSLLNLHTSNPNDSFVRLELENGKNYQIGLNNFTIRDDNKEAAEATSRGSDFINYRFMFRLIDFRHREEIDLFSLFEKDVFPYIKTRNVFKLIHEANESSDFNEIWNDLKKGRNKEDEKGFIIVNVEINQREYSNKLRGFIQELNSILTDVNVSGNEILRTELGYFDIRFELKCIQEFKKFGGGGELSDKESDIPDGSPKITLSIPEYQGLSNAIKKPHSFLNEAKLTAIGIAIRFAILNYRNDYVDGADFQLLVLDDLLISLDMSNRRKVLDLLLNRYTQNYQLIVLTHDKSFYHYAAKKIKVEYGVESDWEIIEMYEDDLSTPSKPYIAKKSNQLTRAEDFFKEHDYPACGFYLRKECESILDDILPDKFKFNVTAGNATIPKNLNDKINSLQEFCQYEGIDYSPFKELKIYKDIILNTLAHNDMNSPIYRQELKSILKIVSNLSNIKRGQIILKTGKDFFLELKNNETEDFVKLSIRTRESFVLVQEEGKPIRLSNFGKCELRQIDTGTGWNEQVQGYDDIKQIIDLYKDQLGITQNYDLLDTLIYRGHPLRDKLNN
ncbi:AAA family ATPase [Runella sp.]|uniref:ATP-binding protein n=1 Tax=Runella sp. TaxID=1960881 RepID=UPI003D12E93F